MEGEFTSERRVSTTSRALFYSFLFGARLLNTSCRDRCREGGRQSREAALPALNVGLRTAGYAGGQGDSCGRPLVSAQVSGPGAGMWSLSVSKGKPGLAISPIAKGPRGGERRGQGREHDHHGTRSSLEQNDACEVLKGRSHPVSQQPQCRCAVETRKPVSVQKPAPGVPQQLYLLRMSLDR